MSASMVLEMESQAVQTKLRFFDSRRVISLRDASDLVAHGIDTTASLRYTWEYPRKALGENGLEAAVFKEVCQKVLFILDAQLTLLDLTRQAAAEAAASSGRTVPRLMDLDQAELQLRQARRRIEDLHAMASRPLGEGIDWKKAQEGEEAIARGEVVRLNPNAPVEKAAAAG